MSGAKAKYQSIEEKRLAYGLNPDGSTVESSKASNRESIRLSQESDFEEYREVKKGKIRMTNDDIDDFLQLMSRARSLIKDKDLLTKTIIDIEEYYDELRHEDMDEILKLTTIAKAIRLSDYIASVRVSKILSYTKEIETKTDLIENDLSDFKINLTDSDYQKVEEDFKIKFDDDESKIKSEKDFDLDLDDALLISAQFESIREDPSSRALKDDLSDFKISIDPTDLISGDSKKVLVGSVKEKKTTVSIKKTSKQPEKKGFFSGFI